MKRKCLVLVAALIFSFGTGSALAAGTQGISATGVKSGVTDAYIGGNGFSFNAYIGGNGFFRGGGNRIYRVTP